MAPFAAESLVTRSLLLVATTLAAGRHMPPARNYSASSNTTCSKPILNATEESDCVLTDAMVIPDHILAPLLFPCIALLITHMPTLLLASRARVQDLKIATSSVVLVWLCGLAITWLSRAHSPSVAYAISLHTSVYLLSQPASHTLTAGMWADRVVKKICMVVVVLCAWQMGPPLPVIDAPGIPRCCGAASHLAGLIAPDIAGPIIAALVGWTLAALGD